MPEAEARPNMGEHIEHSKPMNHVMGLEMLFSCEVWLND
jgi:hypothetical protein